MTIRSQKVISLILISIVAFGGFEALVYILKLNQLGIYIQTAFWIYAYLVIKMVLLFDLHFKNPGSWKQAKAKHEHVTHFAMRWVKVLASAMEHRLAHFLHWPFFRHSLHGIFVPGVIFWSTITLFFINFSHSLIKQVYVLLSGIGLVLSFWYIKEIFYRRKEKVDGDVFVVLTLVKLYSLSIAFAASLALVRRFELGDGYFILSTFCLTFLFIYHAIFQHKLVTFKNVIGALGIAIAMAFVAQLIIMGWGNNYFTATVFMVAIYNVLWGTFHYYLDKTLTLRLFLELLIIGALIAAMMFSVTNFKARIL